MVKAMIRDFYSIAKSIQITLHVRVDTNVTIIDDLIKLKHFFLLISALFMLLCVETIVYL